MWRRRWLLILLVAFTLLVLDLFLANIPGPIPTATAIDNVEHDPTFLSLTKSRVIDGQTVNGTYYYEGYSNDPLRDFTCINSAYRQWFHYINPFHQYTTTTLFFVLRRNKAALQSNVRVVTDQPVYPGQPEYRTRF